MLEINKEEIARFKQEVDRLTSSMEKLKDLSTIKLKVSLPSDKNLDKLASLNTAIASIDTKGINTLGRSLSGLSAVKLNGIGSIYKDLSALSDLNVSTAIGNMRDVSAAYSKFKADTQAQNPTDEEGGQEKKPDTFSSDISGITKFLNVTNKIDPSKTSQVIESLKQISEIKVDDKTAKFMADANGVLSSKNRTGRESSKNNNTASIFSMGKSSQGDITSSVAAALTVLGSSVFLKKQANTAKEVVDLLSASEITGLDAFTNRAGISALGISPTTVANQQRQMNNELMNASLFGEIDPKRLILQNLLGTNFTSSFEQIMKSGGNLPAKVDDFATSTLYGEEFAIGKARYKNARKGATKQQLLDLDNTLFSKPPTIDVGSYTRFLIQFEGFIARSKTLFQTVLGPSIVTLENAFTRANKYITSIDSNSPGLKVASKVIDAFVTSFVGVITFIAEGLENLGDMIIKYNLESTLVKVASVLGTLVAGGAVFKVIAITTSLLTSLLGLKTIFSVANTVIGTLGGLILGPMGGNTKGGGKSGSGGSGGFGKVGGLLTVALAANSIAELGKYLTMPAENNENFWKDKIVSLLDTTGAITATGATAAAFTGAGIPIAAILAAISAASYAGSYTIENPEKTRDLLEGILNAIASTPTPGAVPVNVQIIQDTDGKVRRTSIDSQRDQR